MQLKVGELALSPQSHALDVQIQQATKLRGRLALMRDGMVAGAVPG